MKYLFLLLTLLLINSCTSKKGIKYNQRKDGHFQLYSMPENNIDTSLPSNLKRVILVATNDLLGEIDGADETVTKEKTVQSIKVGGRELLEKYTDILKKNFPDQVLLVDAGNAIKSFSRNSYSRFLQVINTYAKLDYTSLSLGSNDLLLGDSPKKHLNVLKKVIKQSKVPFIISNIVDLSTGEQIDWPNTYPYLIRTINGIKVGIIASVDPTLTKDLPEGTLNGHYVEPIEKAIIKYSRELKRKGAQIIIAKIHAEQNCGEELAKTLQLPLDKVNFDPKDETPCKSNGRIEDIVKRLPPNTVHAIVASKSGGKIANFINGIPTVQSFSIGKYFSVMELFYDIAEDRPVVEKTVIHQPVKLCSEFLKETQDCFMNDNSVNIEKKVKAKFLDKEI